MKLILVRKNYRKPKYLNRTFLSFPNLNKNNKYIFIFLFHIKKLPFNVKLMVYNNLKTSMNA